MNLEAPPLIAEGQISYPFKSVPKWFLFIFFTVTVSALFPLSIHKSSLVWRENRAELRVWVSSERAAKKRNFLT